MRLSGYCPTQRKQETIDVKLLDQSDRTVGRVKCPYVYEFHKCAEKKCPIISENGYHQ